MATEAQIAANRANAKKSTGPKTDAGKARSARNALKHGFRAQIIVDHVAIVEHERPDAFAALLADLVASLRPVGPLEEFCVETVAVAMWRLRRVVGEENNLIDELHVDAEDARELEELERLPGSPDPDPIVYMFLPKPDLLQPLIRYEAHLSRERRAALRELRELQAIRLGLPPLPSPGPSAAGPTSGPKLPNEPNHAPPRVAAPPADDPEPGCPMPSPSPVPPPPVPTAAVSGPGASDTDPVPNEPNRPAAADAAPPATQAQPRAVAPSPPPSPAPAFAIQGRAAASRLPNKPNRTQFVRGLQAAVLGHPLAPRSSGQRR